MIFDAGKTRMIGLRYREKNRDDMLSRFHLIPERNGRTDGQTDGRTDLLTRDKNRIGNFRQTYRFISETIQDMAIDIMEDE